MVWSVSTFFNELDVLEIRLATLDHLVDRFVLAEANVDQRGNPKPLYLGDEVGNPRWDRWADKIVVVNVTDMPTEQPADAEGVAEHWVRENFQRNALIRGMGDLRADDLVLVSDLDEIPYPVALEEALNGGAPIRFPMDMHVYRLDWRWTERPVRDGSTAVVFPGSAFYGGVPVHDVLLRLPCEWRGLPNQPVSSGWHLAYMGDAATIQRKVVAVADNTYVQLVPEEKKASRPRESWQSLEWVEHCVATGEDVYGRDHRRAERVPLDQLPPYVQENPARFAHLLGGWP